MRSGQGGETSGFGQQDKPTAPLHEQMGSERGLEPGGHWPRAAVSM